MTEDEKRILKISEIEEALTEWGIAHKLDLDPLCDAFARIESAIKTTPDKVSKSLDRFDRKIFNAVFRDI